MNPFFQQVIGVIVRTAIVWLAGKFGAQLSESEATRIAAQVAPVLAVMAWAIYQKYRGRLKLLTAAASPKVLTEHEVEAMVDNPMVNTPSVMTAKSDVPR